MLLACTLLVAAAWVRRASAQPSTASIDDLKVAYTLHFLELIRWEEEGANLDFCAYSSSTVGNEMVSALRGRRIRNMQIATRRIGPNDPDIGRCKVIYIPDGAAPQVPQLLNRLRNSQTVTISSIPDFVSAGGIIGFVVVDEQLRFDINKGVAAQNKVKISARLLELAHKVTP